MARIPTRVTDLIIETSSGEMDAVKAEIAKMRESDYGADT